MDGKLLAGQPALITGASSGIGRALALHLAHLGAKLHLAGRDERRLEETGSLAKKEGASVELHRADLLDDAAVARLAAAIGDELGVLIHSAGLVKLGAMAAAELSDLDAQLAINLRAPYALTQRCLPALRRARGQIVFVNSGAGLNARGGWGQYAISKFGLRALADSLREELKDDGVRVLTIYPGRTATPMQEEVHRMENRSYDPSRFIPPDAVAAMVVQALSLPRTAHVTEINVRQME